MPETVTWMARAQPLSCWGQIGDLLLEPFTNLPDPQDATTKLFWDLARSARFGGDGTGLGNSAQFGSAQSSVLTDWRLSPRDMCYAFGHLVAYSASFSLLGRISAMGRLISTLLRLQQDMASLSAGKRFAGPFDLVDRLVKIDEVAQLMAQQCMLYSSVAAIYSTEVIGVKIAPIAFRNEADAQVSGDRPLPPGEALACLPLIVKELVGVDTQHPFQLVFSGSGGFYSQVGTTSLTYAVYVCVLFNVIAACARGEAASATDLLAAISSWVGRFSVTTTAPELAPQNLFQLASRLHGLCTRQQQLHSAVELIDGEIPRPIQSAVAQHLIAQMTPGGAKLERAAAVLRARGLWALVLKTDYNRALLKHYADLQALDPQTGAVAKVELSMDEVIGVLAECGI